MVLECEWPKFGTLAIPETLGTIEELAMNVILLKTGTVDSVVSIRER